MKHKKGETNAIVQTIVGLGIGVIVIAVIAIMLGAFGEGLVTNVAGCNSTNVTGCGVEYDVTVRGLTFLDNATSKFATAGTIVGVLFLLGILGGGAFLGYSAYKKM